MLLTLVTIVHVAVCAMLILIVLLQQGKGADMGATFGGGSNTLFGASGADNLLSRVTTVTAFIFMCTSVFLAQSGRPGIVNSGNLFQNMPETTPPPAAPLDANTGAPIAQPAAPATENKAVPADGQAAQAGAGATSGTAAGTVTDTAAAPNAPAAPSSQDSVPAAPPAAPAEAPKADAQPAAAPAEVPAKNPPAGAESNAPAGTAK
ncbi:MAG: preprotein translocase subunit SecG [Bdellovibrionota bacterium]